MNYAETLQYFESFPPFSPSAVASGEAAFNLNAIRELLRRLGNPERRLKFVHIAGTNGKGSTAAFLRSILTEAGCRTGLFSSPYLTNFTEQMQIDGQEISEEELARIVTRVRTEAEQMVFEGLQAPSAYEVTCAAAFCYFLEQACDLVILEVGLGGRLDATNVILCPCLAVITSISLDHTEILGATLPEIAKEKGGIIKEGGAVLLSSQNEAVTDVIRILCQARHASLCIPEVPQANGLIVDENDIPTAQEFTFHKQRYTTQLLGSYQINNASLAIAAAEHLRTCGFSIPEGAVQNGVKKARWIGRFELISKKPCVVIDGGHNPDGARMLRASLERCFPQKRVIFIVGVLADKAYREMLATLSDLAACFLTITPDSPRALPAETLAEELKAAGKSVESCASMDEAWTKARAAASDEDVICVFGSLYYVGLFRELVVRDQAQ